jgi:ATP-dependent RNA helicase RhlE
MTQQASQENVFMSFSKLGLAPSLYTPLARLGYAEPTPVQAAAIPLALGGADVVARAQTGTGKTAAFGLPMIQRLLLGQRRGATARPLGLVLVPTRELALQVHGALVKYGAAAGVRVAAIFGGVPMPPQMKALRQGTDIVVATPGRLIDHLQRRTLDLSAIEILVLDEADRMLDMGFLPPLRRVLQAMPRARQTLLFSATLSPAVERLSTEFTRGPVRVDVTPADPVASTITHRVHPVDAGGKRALLLHVLTQAPVGQALVFCKTKRGADRVGEHLTSAGLRAAVIHGNKAQGARTRSLAEFKSGRVSVLVATDIAARGLDIAQLPLVVNYDLPLVPEDYVHRVGRTGRAGTKGRAISLVTTADRELLSEIQRLLPGPVEQVAVAGFDTNASATSEHRPRRNPGASHVQGRRPAARHTRGTSQWHGARRASSPASP